MERKFGLKYFDKVLETVSIDEIIEKTIKLYKQFCNGSFGYNFPWGNPWNNVHWAFMNVIGDMYNEITGNKRGLQIYFNLDESLTMDQVEYIKNECNIKEPYKRTWIRRPEIYTWYNKEDDEEFEKDFEKNNYKQMRNVKSFNEYKLNEDLSWYSDASDLYFIEPASQINKMDHDTRTWDNYNIKFKNNKLNESFSSFKDKAVQLYLKLKHLFKNINFHLTEEEKDQLENINSLKDLYRFSFDVNIKSKIDQIIKQNKDEVRIAYNEIFGLNEEMCPLTLISIIIMVGFLIYNFRGKIKNPFKKKPKPKPYRHREEDDDLDFLRKKEDDEAMY